MIRRTFFLPAFTVTVRFLGTTSDRTFVLGGPDEPSVRARLQRNLQPDRQTVRLDLAGKTLNAEGAD